LLISLCISAIPIAMWWLRSRTVSASGYLAPFLSSDPYNSAAPKIGIGRLASRAASNMHEYASEHLSVLVFGTTKAGIAFGLAFVVLIVLGWSRRVRSPGIAELWVPFYIAMVIVWPEAWASPRFILPVVPVLALYVCEAAGWLAGLARAPRIISGALTIAVIIAVVPVLQRRFEIGRECRVRYERGEAFPCTEPTFQDFFETAELARGKLPPKSVVISRKPTIFFLHSGYQSRMYPLTRVPDSLFAEEERIGARYVVVDHIEDLAPRYLHPVMLARRDAFCMLPELSTEYATMTRIEIGGPRTPESTPLGAFRPCEEAPNR
jgi:hypothetical protein